jgi:hypothetical protein
MKKKPKTTAGQKRKMKAVLDEWKAGKLRSGSKHGPIVRNQKQAVAIALSQSGQSNKSKAKKKRPRSRARKEK